MPAVSVILPTHNRAPLLHRAIQSVLRQSHEDFELIIIDDCSEDETEQILRSFDDPRLRIARLKQRSGAGAARNAGIRMAQSSLIAFQDSDDEWLSPKLSTQLSVLSSDEACGFVYHDLCRVRSDHSTCDILAPDLPASTLIHATGTLWAVENIGIQSCVIRTELLHKAGLFNEDLPAFEDLELFIRLNKVVKGVRIKQSLVRYYQSEGISSNPARLAQAKRMLLEMYAGELNGERKFIFQQLNQISALERVAAAATLTV